MPRFACALYLSSLLVGICAWSFAQPSPPPPAAPVSLSAMPADRARPFVTKLAVNQAYLDAIATPPAADGLTKWFAELAGREGAGEVPAVALAEMVGRWRLAERMAREADDGRAARYFLALARQYPAGFLGQLALLEAARWQQRVGRDAGPEGATALFDRLARQSPWLRVTARQGLAEVALGRGDYAAAREAYAALAGAGTPVEQAWTRYRLAQLAEFAGDWPTAAAGFAACAQSADATVATEARYAVKRVQALAGTPMSPAPTVRYLGEDRATQGDWHTRYGREGFILCAQQAPQDVAGGSLGGWPVVPTVGSPREKARYWVTDASEDDRSFLYNPLSRVRRAANWDDRGEAYPLGTGPDLLFEAPIPAGEHVLSLYFVNDRNYYEPNRVYTISVCDERGTYQAGAEVRAFARGVYYRFAVTGPQRLRFRLWRNLAVNLIFAGLFLDRPGEPPAWPAQVALWAPHRTTVALPPPPVAAGPEATGPQRREPASQPAPRS